MSVPAFQRRRRGHADIEDASQGKLGPAQPDLDGTISDSKSLQLSQFEMAQLANLTISDVDEARTLIPTLASKDEAQLESLLNELAAIRRFS
ncbi:RNA polymerase B [Malassezia psittaci]|uniref:RNA polymerase B n=1 Tax=Malassezia psittaci TaxID=1821823 RepID=A0AAF0JDU8_9BASI|nr:RNA polymerase B [Malassezia psittaci]